MPFISTKTNIEITKERELSIKQRLGKAIGLVPGKSEEWLMLSFEDRANMYFKGKADKPIAFVDVKVFGGSTAEAYDKLTSAITGILNEELDIPAEQVFVKYEEAKFWGWNGSNL